MDQSSIEDGTVMLMRTTRGTLRTVEYRNHRVYKHFATVRWPGDLRKPWRREAKALKHLQQNGIECPQFFSLEEEHRKAVLCKGYIVGEPLSKITDTNVKLVAGTLAKINATGVFTCDPHVGNFLEVTADKFIFIDFGRSRIFRSRLFFFLFYLGKERARIAQLLLSESDHGLKEAFWNAYSEALGPINDPMNISVLSEKYWLNKATKKEQQRNEKA